MAHPVADEQLIAYAAGDLAGPAADAVAAHIGGCPGCAATVARYRGVAAAVAADDSVPPPAAIVARAKAIFPRREPAAAGALAALRRVVADLTFDSRGGFALAGVRSGGGGSGRAYQLAYESEAGDLDLQLEPPAAPDARWRLLGQVGLDDDLPGIRVALAAPGGDAPLAETEADPHGVFDLAAVPGTYDLSVALPTAVIVVPNLDVG